MQRENRAYICVRILRFTLALSLFACVSLLSRFFAYFMAQRQTEDVIRVIHIVISILAYHSFLRIFLITDKSARCRFYDSQIGAFKFLISSFEVIASFFAFTLFFFLFPAAFAVESLHGWVEIGKEYIYAISFAAFLVTFVITWIEAVGIWRKTEEKLRKEKSRGKDVSMLVKGCVSAFLAYPITAYFLPALFPTFETLPSVAVVVLTAILPVVLVLFAVFTSFDYIRAFFIRFRFLRKLEKSARKNGYILSKIKRPYMSLFKDFDGESFSVTASGKTYLCKLICGLHYGNHIHFAEEGKGVIVNSLRLKIFFHGRSGLGRIGWHNGEELARIETHFSYAFDGEGKKVLIICPTPHSIYAIGQGQKKLLDVNDKVYGYTIMTGTGFINALERDAVK